MNRKGFRKDMNPEKLLNLTEDEKNLVKSIRDANERKLKNEIAFKCFIESDQAVIQKENLIDEINELVVNILDVTNQKTAYQIDLTKGSTEKMDMKSNTKLELSDLPILILRIENITRKYLRQMRLDFAKLYNFVGTMKLDKSIMLTEEEYNKLYEDAVSKLHQAKLKII
jgi:hypothetical protein